MEEQWDIAVLEAVLERDFALQVGIKTWLDEDAELDDTGIQNRILEHLDQAYQEKENKLPDGLMRQFEKSVMLQILDAHWKEHLAAMDYLRQGIHLRGYAQKNPKQEYKREAFEMFTALLDRIQYEVAIFLAKVQFQERAPEPPPETQQQREAKMRFEHAEASALAGGDEEEEPEAAAPSSSTPYVRQERKVGRNEPCPCGSGKKYKHCHGRLG